jgi:hypothetical protein
MAGAVTPADAHKLATALYADIGHLLAVHVACRTHSVMVLAAARAMGLDAELCHRTEDSHYFVRFGDGSVSENWFGDIRLRPPS